MDGKALETLIELGEQSTPGEDKHLVLTTLNESVNRVCRRVESQGDTLETLIPRQVDRLASDAQPGTRRNFYTAAEILQRIVVATHHKPRKVDLMYAIPAVSPLSRVALAHPASNIAIENTLMNCIESLGWRRIAILPRRPK